MLLWYDLSPMRPDEFGRTRAMRWTEATQAQRAYREGIADAEREAGLVRREMDPVA